IEVLESLVRLQKYLFIKTSQNKLQKSTDFWFN
ncbi:uncharacterized protein METZ01_LOCUS280959, partial [marine metagenome]